MGGNKTIPNTQRSRENTIDTEGERQKRLSKKMKLGLSNFLAEKETGRKGSKRDQKSKRETTTKCHESSEINFV